MLSPHFKNSAEQEPMKDTSIKAACVTLVRSSFAAILFLRRFCWSSRLIAGMLPNFKLKNWPRRPKIASLTSSVTHFQNNFDFGIGPTTRRRNGF